MTRAFGNEAVRYNNLEKRGYTPDFSIQQLMWLDYWVIDSWQQNDDGTTTGFSNYITQEEFDQLIGVVRLYAACTS